MERPTPSRIPYFWRIISALAVLVALTKAQRFRLDDGSNYELYRAYLRDLDTGATESPEGNHTQVCLNTGGRCPCIQEGCEFVDWINHCTDQAKYCGWKDENHICGLTHFCIRAGVWYSTAGLLCEAFPDCAVDPCIVEETVLAVNLGGRAYTDRVRNIHYMADSHVPRFPSAEERYMETGTANTVGTVGSPANEAKLYEHVIYLNGRERCDTYELWFRREGLYELSIKTKEPCWEEEKQRFFNVRLAGEQVFTEVDIFAYAQERNKAIELAANFEIMNFKMENDSNYCEMHITGFARFDRLPKCMALLEFCSSECPVPDPQFVAAAFSVVRFFTVPEIEVGPEPPSSTWNPDTAGLMARSMMYSGAVNDDAKPTPPTPAPEQPPPAPTPWELPYCSSDLLGLTWPWPGTSTQYLKCACSGVCFWEHHFCAFGKRYSMPHNDCIW